MRRNNATIADILPLFTKDMPKNNGFNRDGNVVRPFPLDMVCEKIGGEGLKQRYDGEIILLPLIHIPGVRYLGPINGQEFCFKIHLENPMQLESGLVVSRRVAEESGLPHTSYNVGRELYVLLLQ